MSICENWFHLSDFARTEQRQYHTVYHIRHLQSNLPITFHISDLISKTQITNARNWYQKVRVKRKLLFVFSLECAQRHPGIACQGSIWCYCGGLHQISAKHFIAVTVVALDIAAIVSMLPFMFIAYIRAVR